MDKPRPDHYKIPRPESSENLSWDVVSVMWEHANFYEDEDTYKRSIAPATVGQLAVYACGCYLSEVHNGGHDQFFSNPTGMVWRDALNGFQLLGAGPYGAILAEAVAQFPDAQPSLDRSERESQVEAIQGESQYEDTQDDAFDDLDKRIYELEDAFEICATQYILAHPDQFFTNP